MSQTVYPSKLEEPWIFVKQMISRFRGQEKETGEEKVTCAQYFPWSPDIDYPKKCRKGFQLKELIINI